VDVHHIVPWEICLKHEYENLIALCPNCHRMAHQDRIDRKSLRIYKANLRYTHDRFSQLEVDMLFELFGKPVGEGIQWPPYLAMLIKRLLDAKYVEVIPNQRGAVFIGGMRSDPDLYVISDLGRQFVTSLGLEHENW
jgi:hypothetical protein